VSSAEDLQLTCSLLCSGYPPTPRCQLRGSSARLCVTDTRNLALLNGSGAGGMRQKERQTILKAIDPKDTRTCCRPKPAHVRTLGDALVGALSVRPRTRRRATGCVAFPAKGDSASPRLPGVVFFRTVPRQALINDRDVAPARASNGVLHDFGAAACTGPGADA
jgi:hypothetical protein